MENNFTIICHCRRHPSVLHHPVLKEQVISISSVIQMKDNYSSFCYLCKFFALLIISEVSNFTAVYCPPLSFCFSNWLYIHLNGILGINNNRKVYQCIKQTAPNSLDHMHTEPGVASHFRMTKTSVLGLNVPYTRSKFSTFTPDIVIWLHGDLSYGLQWAALQPGIQKWNTIHLATEPLFNSGQRKGSEKNTRLP